MQNPAGSTQRPPGMRISFTIRKKGTSRKRRRVVEPQKQSERPSAQAPIVAKKLAKVPPSSAAASMGETSFVSVKEIISVKNSMKDLDLNARWEFVKRQASLAAEAIDPKGEGTFSSEGLFTWMREVNKNQTRARFAEIYSGKPMRGLRYSGNSTGFEAKLARYSLQANLTTTTNLSSTSQIGDAYFAIDKLSDIKPSFTLYLFQTGFSINSRDKHFQRYNPKNRAMLQAIDNGEIPSFADNLIQSLPATKYYNGCLVVEIHDYRHLNRWSTKPKVGRILLEPTTYTLHSDALALAVHYKSEKGQDGLSVSGKTLQEACNYFEEKLLMVSGPLLCFENSPRVLQAASLANYNRRMNIIQRLPRVELRTALKAPRQRRQWRWLSAVEFSSSVSSVDGPQEAPLSKSETDAQVRERETQISTCEDVKMEEEKSTPEKATKEEKTQPALFSPRTKDKSKATLALLKKIRRRNTDANGGNVREFSAKHLRHASFIHYTKDDRSAFLHGLLLRDPEVTRTLLAGAGSKQMAKTNKSARKDSAAARAQGNMGGSGVSKSGVSDKKDSSKKYWSQNAKQKRASPAANKAHTKIAPKVPGVHRADGDHLKRVYSNNVKKQVKAQPKAFNLAAHAQAHANATYNPGTTPIVTTRTTTPTQQVVRPATATQNVHNTSAVMYTPTSAQRPQNHVIPTATARQPTVLLSAPNLGMGVADAKAQTVMPTAFKVSSAAAAQRQQQALMQRMIAQQKQLQQAAALANAGNMSAAIHQQLMQSQYFMNLQNLNLAYRNHQQMSKNLKKQHSQILKGAAKK
ncbi:hypothetical protein AAMO2058_000641800 [Amorphochlora amoebiformis]